MGNIGFIIVRNIVLVLLVVIPLVSALEYGLASILFTLPIMCGAVYLLYPIVCRWLNEPGNLMAMRKTITSGVGLLVVVVTLCGSCVSTCAGSGGAYSHEDCEYHNAITGEPQEEYAGSREQAQDIEFANKLIEEGK